MKDQMLKQAQELQLKLSKLISLDKNYENAYRSMAGVIGCIKRVDS